MIAYKQLGFNGRLGNQLWQIASTIGIANKIGEDPAFPDTWKYRDYFCVPQEFFHSEATIEHASDVLDSPLLNHLGDMRSYMQDVSLFSHIDYLIVAMFQPTAKALSSIPAWYRDLPRPINAVHVRRGDNVYEGAWKAAYHPVPSLRYYNDAALAVFGDRWTAAPVGSCVIFSDDIAWCKKELAGNFYFEGGVPMPKEHEPAYIAAQPTDWIDFFGLCCADRFVLSNSTFGWWAAFLSGSPDVAYPNPWFGPALDYIDSTLMFTGLEWLALNAD